MGASSSVPAELLPVSEAALCDDVRAYLLNAGRVANIAHHFPISIIRMGYLLGHSSFKNPRIPEYEAGVTAANMQMHCRYGPDLTPNVVPLRVYTPAVTAQQDTAAATDTAASADSSILDASSGSDDDCIVLYFHGGGWTIGSLDTHDSLCRLIAYETKYPVVSVEYSLSPEHKATSFPNALDDCVYAYDWVVSNAAHIFSSAGRKSPSLTPKIILSGDSAGGALSLSVALRIRDHNRAVGGASLPVDHAALGPAASVRLGLLTGISEPLPSPLLCAPIYPLTQHAAPHASRKKYAWGYELTQGLVDVFTEAYFGREAAACAADGLLSPLLSPDLSGLPPTLLMTAEFDMLHDEGVAFVERMRALGMPCEHIEGRGQLHGFATLFGAVPSARALMQHFAARMRANVREALRAAAGRKPAH